MMLQTAAFSTVRSVLRATSTTVLVLLAFAGVADARTFRGHTSQDRTASLVSAKTGAPVRVRVSWVATCRHGEYAATTIFAPPSTATRTRAAGTARTILREKGDIRSHITATLRLQRVVAGGAARWSGTLTPSVTVRRAGRTIDRCRAAAIGVRVG